MTMFVLPKAAPVSGGDSYAGGKLYFYLTGTTTLATIYTDAARTTAHANPVIADAGGVFAPIWLNPTISYRVQLKTSADVLVYDVDPYPGTGALTAGDIGILIYKRTDAEIAASVTPVNFVYGPGDSRRWNILSDGATNNAAAIQNWLNAAAGDVPARLYNLGGSGSIKCGATISVPSKTTLEIQPGVVLEMTLDNTPLLKGLGVTDVTIQGGEILGVQGAVDWPSPSTNSEGLIYFANNGATQSERIRVENTHVRRTWTPMSFIRVKKLWVERNEVHDYMRYGILASQSVDFHIDHNTVYDSNTTVAVAYGIMATGDAAGGFIQARSSISFNKIYDIPSWDGIMSHDVDGLMTIGNDIRNVRKGIDVGHLAATNVVKNIVVADNYIESTATNTWGGTAAEHGAIFVAGFDATNRVLGLTISGNICRNFFTTAGMIGAGDPNHITVSNADDAAINGNVVAGGGAIINNAGLSIAGTCNRLAVTGNTLQGDMGRGGIRLSSVTADVASIVGNVIKQTTASVTALEISGSTITAFSEHGNVTNSTVPFSQATSTLTFAGMTLEGSATYDPPSLADGAGATTTVTVTGAALGDFAVASFGGDLAGVSVTAYVSSVDTVSVRFQNESGGIVDLGSTTLRVRVYKKH